MFSIFWLPIFFVLAFWKAVTSMLFLCVLIHYKKYQAYVFSQAVIVIAFIASNFVFFYGFFDRTDSFSFAVLLFITSSVLLFRKNTHVLSLLQRKVLFFSQIVILLVFSSLFLISQVYYRSDDSCETFNKKSTNLLNNYGLSVGFCDGWAPPKN